MPSRKSPQTAGTSTRTTIRTLARQQAVKTGVPLDEKEMRALVDALFACRQHNITPGGDPTFIEFRDNYLEKLFGR